MVVQQQLQALQNDDIATVYKFASPRNKQQQSSIEQFDQMIRHEESPYRHLIGHVRADILMEATNMKSKQYLVRVVVVATNNNKKKMKKDYDMEKDNISNLKDGVCYNYWWSLSRCQGGGFDGDGGQYAGSYMVDAVFPTI